MKLDAFMKKVLFLILQSNSTVTSLDVADTNLGADGVRHLADLLRENHFITELVGLLCLSFPIHPPTQSWYPKKKTHHLLDARR